MTPQSLREKAKQILAQYSGTLIENGGSGSMYEFAQAVLDLLDQNEKYKDKEHYLKIILKWKYLWMDQTQNSEADRKNYYSRAFGVDANMQYSLAKMLAEAHFPKEDGDEAND